MSEFAYNICFRGCISDDNLFDVLEAAAKVMGWKGGMKELENRTYLFEYPPNKFKEVLSQGWRLEIERLKQAKERIEKSDLDRDASFIDGIKWIDEHIKYYEQFDS
jgi:hypothetical protein